VRPKAAGHRLQDSGFGKKKQEGRKIPLLSPFMKGGGKGDFYGPLPVQGHREGPPIFPSLDGRG